MKSMFRGRSPILWVCLLALCAPNRSSAQSVEAGEPSLGAQLAAQREAEILPGDRIQLRIWREPDWSGQFSVDDRGVVVLPRLGPVQVDGMSVSQVRQMLTERYSDYLRTPAIEVTVLRRIGVHGEVKMPTLYWVDLTMTLRDAIAMAGGLTPTGDPNKILVDRGGERLRFGEAETAATLAAGLQSGDQIVVERQNWFVLNTPFVISTLVSVSSILVGFLIAR